MNRTALRVTHAAPPGLVRRAVAALCVGLALLHLVPSPAMAQTAENPLPLCPETPNCERETHRFAGVEPDALFRQALAALDEIGPAEVRTAPDSLRLEAVFRVFVFKDDFALAVTPTSDGAALHLRSASRVGRSDLGVNRRRVDRFLEALEARR